VGELGDGTTADRTTPVQISKLTGPITLAAGDEDSVSVKSDGTLWVSGANNCGQLGDGASILNSNALQDLSRLESREDLHFIFGDLFAEKLFARSEKGANRRRRSLPPDVTFWAFVAQALSPKSSCREIVARIEAWWRWGQLRSAQR
jgi:hypothetical protein